jgi:hypothetical protein
MPTNSVWSAESSTADVFLERVPKMGCDLKDYRARVGARDARTVRCAQGRNINGQVGSYLANTCLCAAVLAVLLIIGGVEQNPGPGVEGESFMQVMCNGCDRSLKSGTQCDNVDVGFITAAETVRLHWQTVGSGTVKGVNGKGFAC